MRLFSFVFLLSTSALLLGCGAADRGVSLKKEAALGGTGKVIHVTESANLSDVNFNTCYPVSLYSAANNPDLSIALLFDKSAICPSITHADFIKVKPGPNLNTSQRVCLIASIANTFYPEKCLTISGETMLELDVKNATRVDMIREVDLTQFKMYRLGTTPFYPSGSFANFQFSSSAK